MRLPTLIAGTLAAASLLAGNVAHAQQSACLTEAELNSVVTFALPVAMESVMKTCQPSLSPSGWFATKGPALIQGYAARKQAAWPTARGALMKLGKGDDKMAQMVTRLPDSALQPFAEGIVGQIVTDGVKPDQCVAIERATRLLSPLPPENTAELISFIIVMAEKPKPGAAPAKSKLPICAAKS